MAVHPLVSDVLVIPNYGPRNDLRTEDHTVVVDVHCGTAVMRGADVFAPGVQSAPKGMTLAIATLCQSHHCTGLRCGDAVSVFSDLNGRCLRGSTEYDGEILHVGNGIARLSRQDLFGPDLDTRYIELRYTRMCALCMSLLSNMTPLALSHLYHCWLCSWNLLHCDHTM